MSKTTERAASHGGRNSDIECLRAVAVLGVAFHHMQGNLFHPGLAWLADMLKHADFWFGVDLFFVISGFVIARSLLPQMAAAEKTLRPQARVIGAFWIRRFWRLLPSAWLWLGLMLLAAIALNRSGAFGSVHANVMATLSGMADVANFRFAKAFFHYEYGASFVYWSLSLEEQFYILLPVLVVCLRRRIDLLMIALFVIQLCVIRTPLLMVVRTDALALGVLLAIAAPGGVQAALNPRFLSYLGPLRTLLPCLLLAALALLSSADMGEWRLRVSAIAVVSAVLVWLASYNENYLLRDGRLKHVFVWIGARSYAIYLIHVPVYFLLREVNFRWNVHAGVITTWPAWLLFVVAVGAVALLSDLNYRYFEQPLRRHGRRAADRFMVRWTPCAIAEAATTPVPLHAGADET